MKRVIKLVLVVAVLLTTIVANAQDDVTLTVSGEGSTKEEATTNALRSAIEQTYGVFVSSDLSLMNESVVRDEIATLAKGNVKSFEELSSFQKADNNWFVTLKATVSPSALIEYTRAHGGRVEFAGAMFAQSMKLIELNTKNEKIAMTNMYHQLCSLLSNMFYYTIENLQEPKIEDVYVRKEGEQLFETSKERYYSIYADFVIRNNVYNQEFYNVLHSTLKSISLSEEERQMFKSRNLPVYSLVISDSQRYYEKENSVIYYLRNEYRLPIFDVKTQTMPIHNDEYKFDKDCRIGACIVEDQMCNFSVVTELVNGSDIMFRPIPLYLIYEKGSQNYEREIYFYKRNYRYSSGFEKGIRNIPPRIVTLNKDLPDYHQISEGFSRTLSLVKNEKDIIGYIYYIPKYEGYSGTVSLLFTELFDSGSYPGRLSLNYGTWNTFKDPGSVFAKCRIKLSFSESELANIKSIKVVSDSHQAILPK